MFIAAIVVGIIAIIALIAGILRQRYEKREEVQGDYGGKPLTGRITTLVGAVLAAFTIVALVFSSVYTQDAGEANVLKDVTGNIVGQNNNTGLQTKAPWVNTVTFNIRNQQVVYAGPSGSQSDNNGGTASGPQITAQDRDGVTSNIDIALRYSIKPSSVTDIYKEFLSEENFKKSFIEQDVRSVVRAVPNRFSTLDLLTKRGDVEAAILEALQDRWADDGVIVDSISLQEIRPPEEVVKSYAAAQQAQINVAKEQANLDAAEVSAQQKVVQAQAEAEANRLLSESLTPQIIQQRLIDAYKEGTVFVVPEGTNPLIQVPSGK